MTADKIPNGLGYQQEYFFLNSESRKLRQVVAQLPWEKTLVAAIDECTNGV